jgi:molybdopterin/thiamine biosynthesis adenylyltransferase
MTNDKIQELLPGIAGKAQQKTRGDGSSYLSLSFSDQQQLSEANGVSPRNVQISALQNDIVPEVYVRNQKSLSNAEQVKLLQTHVAIIGLGGLGGTVTEILARVGIGALTLVDGDVFEDSNLNRQLLSSTDQLGKPKAAVAAARVAALNPAVDTREMTEFLTLENAPAILADTAIAVDCLDSIASRFLLEQGCRDRGIPLVTAAIGGTSGQAMVIYPGDIGLSQIYGNPDTAADKGVEKTLGTLPFAAITLACIESAEVVRIAIGRGPALRNRLLITDLFEHSSDLVDFS